MPSHHPSRFNFNFLLQQLLLLHLNARYTSYIMPLWPIFLLNGSEHAIFSKIKSVFARQAQLNYSWTFKRWYTHTLRSISLTFKIGCICLWKVSPHWAHKIFIDFFSSHSSHLSLVPHRVTGRTIIIHRKVQLAICQRSGGILHEFLLLKAHTKACSKEIYKSVSKLVNLSALYIPL